MESVFFFTILFGNSLSGGQLSMEQLSQKGTTLLVIVSLTREVLLLLGAFLRTYVLAMTLVAPNLVRYLSFVNLEIVPTLDTMCFSYFKFC